MIIHTGNDQPALKLLNKHVRKGASSKWHDLGLELLEQEDEEILHKFKCNNPNNMDECCKEMFQLWLRKSPDATWNQLIQALKEVELNNLAATIEGMLMPTQDTVCASAGKTIIDNNMLKYICILYCGWFIYTEACNHYNYLHM